MVDSRNFSNSSYSLFLTTRLKHIERGGSKRKEDPQTRGKVKERIVKIPDLYVRIHFSNKKKKRLR